MGTTTTNLGLYKPTVGETGWGALVDANFDTLDLLTAGIYNVKSYGALGDGSTNDTAAIQAALDAADVDHGVVYVPPSIDAYKFSNLKIGQGVSLVGAGIGATWLQRITGSTGNAIREKTAGEGNAGGATRIQLRDFTLDGNSTVGNGVDMGFAGGSVWSSGGLIANLYIQNFTSGIGLHINNNADLVSHVWGVGCQDGIHIDGGGFSHYYGLFCEENTRYQLRVGGAWDDYFGVQIETAVSNTTPCVLVEGDWNTLHGVKILYNAVATKTSHIEIASGSVGDMFSGVVMIGSGPYTHGIRSADWSVGTGTDQFVQSFVMGLAGDAGQWYLENGDGTLVTKQIGGYSKNIAQGVHIRTLSYSTTIATDVSVASIFIINATNGTAFTISNPTNATEGQIVTYQIVNLSGGAMGTITWGTGGTGRFALAGAFTNPANGKVRTITFYYDGATWVELSRVAADI